MLELKQSWFPGALETVETAMFETWELGKLEPGNLGPHPLIRIPGNTELMESNLKIWGLCRPASQVSRELDIVTHALLTDLNSLLRQTR